MRPLNPNCPLDLERIEQLRQRTLPELPADYRRQLEQAFAPCCGRDDGDLEARGGKR
jgi:hypothetical protein